MRFEELLERWEKGSLSHAEAASALGVSDRTLRRWRQRYDEEGADGLVDRRVGEPSPRRAPEDELERMRTLYQQDYSGFTIKHFHEKLEQRHGYKLGYTTTRLYLQKTGTVPPAPRRGAHRRKRPRRPMRGMMLHQDGSKHAWLAGQPALDLIITMDDATSEIYSALLIEEEGTMSSFRGLVEVIERQGLFMELYTDRGSHYFFTPEAVVSRGWWKLRGAAPRAWWGGSGGEVKIGGRALQGGPAVDPAQGDLTRGEQRPEQHGGGLGAGQQALGLDPALELLVQPLDGVRGPERAPLLGRVAQEGEQALASLLQAVDDRATAQLPARPGAVWRGRGVRDGTGAVDRVGRGARGEAQAGLRRAKRARL